MQLNAKAFVVFCLFAFVEHVLESAWNLPLKLWHLFSEGESGTPLCVQREFSTCPKCSVNSCWCGSSLEHGALVLLTRFTFLLLRFLGRDSPTGT